MNKMALFTMLCKNDVTARIAAETYEATTSSIIGKRSKNRLNIFLKKS